MISRNMCAAIVEASGLRIVCPICDLKEGVFAIMRARISNTADVFRWATQFSLTVIHEKMVGNACRSSTTFCGVRLPRFHFILKKS